LGVGTVKLMSWITGFWLDPLRLGVCTHKLEEHGLSFRVGTVKLASWIAGF
jgi:hypothetical protein